MNDDQVMGIILQRDKALVRIAALESSLQELYDYSPHSMANPSDDVVYQEVKRRAKALLGEARGNGGVENA